MGKFADKLKASGSDFAGRAILNFIRGYTGSSLTDANIQQNEFNAQEAQKNRDFQQEMSNTEYSRAVADMKSAGINPAFAMNNGGVSTPSGATASGSVSSGSGNLGELLQAFMLPTQLKALKADIGVKQSQEDLNEAHAESIRVNTDFSQQTFELRKTALELSNSLSREQKDLIYQKRQESIAQMKKLNEEALTESTKRALNQATEILQRAEAFEIVQLMPYKIQLMEAQTASEKAQASLYAVNQLYQQKLIDSGYIDSLCRQMEASASGTESDSVVKGITAKLRSGNTLDPADFGDSKVSNFLEGVWNGLVTESVNNGIAVVTNLLEYMPSVLLAPGAPGAQVKSRTPLIYGPDGQTVSSVVR